MTPYYADDLITVYHGDCRDVLAGLEPASVDAVVCDPPYELGFMGQQWDGTGVAYLPETWAAVLRVLKPGGHLLSFGGTRTFHRMTVAIEDAGFEVRDCLSWLYGSGFPKSLDVSKAIDKAAGAERDEIPVGSDGAVRKPRAMAPGGPEREAIQTVSDPVTDEARQWGGWGTALKPAWEPIVLARKPLVGTVAGNVLENGTGALNIDGCRVEGLPRTTHADGNRSAASIYGNDMGGKFASDAPAGRWPANVTLDEDAAAMLDHQSGTLKSGGGVRRPNNTPRSSGVYNCSQDGSLGGPDDYERAPDAGGASRFFYTAKANRQDRGEGNTHPTVKPVALMRWLVRLVTPPGGLVLDPFAGSGTTAEAAITEGFRALLIEAHGPYLPIIEARVKRPMQPNMFGGAA